MSRTQAFAALAHALRLARCSARSRIPPADALGHATAPGAHTLTRRRFLEQVAAAAAATTAAAAAPPRIAPRAPSLGIVGAGLAGLACADALRAAGLAATLYDAAPRSGGRCWSLRGFFPGQVAERGGELLDNLHKTMLGYVKRFRLTLEDMGKQPGEVAYWFAGQSVPEAVVVAELRAFIPVLKADLRRLSSAPSALASTAADRALDAIDLWSYLSGQNGRGVPAPTVAKAAIVAAYEAEYGLAAAQQSCLNFLLFFHADRRAKFTPFGVFSDERYHVVEGNDAIVQGLEAGLATPVQHGHRLLDVRLAAGRVVLTFDAGGSTVTATHDAVVLAIPFTTLRQVQLAAQLAIPTAQLAAIANLGYGTNAKTMVGFTSRPWWLAGSSGASYSDLRNHQATWETNPSGAGTGRAMLTDYASAARGASLTGAGLQAQVAAFLGDLERLYPGALAAAATSGSGYLAHLEPWPGNPLALGSYTCYLPGQFTTVAGLEGQQAGNLHFAGEHTDSFYSWQGFMEGAALSGIRAAKEILADIKAGRL